MEHMKLHHVGIVMSPMDRAERFMKKFGLETDYMEYVEAYKANCLFTKHNPDETPIELVIPLEGVLTMYNNGRGGIHHIAFEVDDVEAARKWYEAEGLEMLEKSAVPGAGGIIVNFLRPRFGEGILVEFVEKIK
ncbi:VOC family protein [Clostridium sp. AM58-1XD]|uniref:VOC family protein n=1 Tax=Clostridium sp. AM58-1XD TaxID=2292307 RepID=UPI000E5024B8|nr:VOC family protein [Clostridium sp. AM58-1XD]RGZ01568.1 VOC family protein [Clostridium sp. AM58-1XD]